MRDRHWSMIKQHFKGMLIVVIEFSWIDVWIDITFHWKALLGLLLDIDLFYICVKSTVWFIGKGLLHLIPLLHLL